MPALCPHHASVYRTRAAAIRHLPHGHKALARDPVTDDPYRCPWCQARFAVPSLTRDHLPKCPARPTEEKRP